MRCFFGSKQPSESGLFLDSSGSVVLECVCGEKLMLLGQEQDWREEGCTVFRCECGRELTLAEERVGEKALAIEELLRRSKKESSPRRLARRSTCFNGAAWRLPEGDSSPPDGSARISEGYERDLG